MDWQTALQTDLVLEEEARSKFLEFECSLCIWALFFCPFLSCCLRQSQQVMTIKKEEGIGNLNSLNVIYISISVSDDTEF